MAFNRSPTAGDSPHKTLYNRFIRSSRKGVFDRIFTALSREGPPHDGEPSNKGDAPRLIGRTKGGLNSKLHTVCDGQSRPVLLRLSEGQMSDHKGARLLLDAFFSAIRIAATVPFWM